MIEIFSSEPLFVFADKKEQPKLMKLKASIFIILIIVAGIFGRSLSAHEIKTLSSPDGKLSLTIQFAKNGSLSYSFAAYHRTIINDSPLGLADDSNNTLPSGEWLLSNSKQRSVKSVWKPIWGKRAVVPDQYNEIQLDLTGPNQSTLNHLRLEVRAYNDGVAFRYCIPAEENNSLIATSELTRYNFAGDYTAWYYNGENHNIGPEKLSETNGKRLPVMTLRIDSSLYLGIHEADLTVGAPLVLQSEKGSTAFWVASAPGKLDANYHSAWRVILCGRTPGKLVDSHLIELLNPEPKGDFSWVKPGVAVWDWRIDGAQIDGFTYTMSYPSWIRMVDFAAENNIRNLVLDANWYGPEHEAESDPVKGDKANDVRKLLQYGKEKGVGIWLYLNDVGGRKYPIKETLKQYGEWGAAGVKYGFMSGKPDEKKYLDTQNHRTLCSKSSALRLPRRARTPLWTNAHMAQCNYPRILRSPARCTPCFFAKNVCNLRFCEYGCRTHRYE